MNKTLFAVALVGATLAAFPAQAETFDGPYVGVQAGYNRAEIADSVEARPLDAETARNAFVLGGYAGYNKTVGSNIVIGAEAGFGAALDDEVQTVSDGAALEINPRYSFDLTARAGYLASDKLLVYVRGGYANARVRTTLADAEGSVTSSGNLDGWLVGGGVEYALTDSISARTEYRFQDLGNDGGQYDRHQALVGISYNF